MIYHTSEKQPPTRHRHDDDDLGYRKLERHLTTSSMTVSRDTLHSTIVRARAILVAP